MCDWFDDGIVPALYTALKNFIIDRLGVCKYVNNQKYLLDTFTVGVSIVYTHPYDDAPEWKDTYRVSDLKEIDYPRGDYVNAR